MRRRVTQSGAARMIAAAAAWSVTSTSLTARSRSPTLSPESSANPRTSFTTGVELGPALSTMLRPTGDELAGFCSCTTSSPAAAAVLAMHVHVHANVHAHAGPRTSAKRARGRPGHFARIQCVPRPHTAGLRPRSRRPRWESNSADTTRAKSIVPRLSRSWYCTVKSEH